MRPVVSAAVIVTVILAPGRSVARRSARVSSRTGARSRGTVRVRERVDGQPLPVQRNTTRAPRGALRTVRSRSFVRRPSTDQLLSTSARSSANGSARESQFSSTALPLTSSAPGRINALASLQSAGTGNPSASRSRTMLSRPSQSSSMPFSSVSRGAREDRPVGVVAVDVGGEAVAVAVLGALALGDDVDEVVADGVAVGAAGDPLGVAVQRLDGVVAALAEVVVDALLAVERVVAVAAGEDVSARAAVQHVVAGAAERADGIARPGDGQDVVQIPEVDVDARPPRARDLQSRLGVDAAVARRGADCRSRS